MKEYKVKFTLQYEVIKYIDAESEEGAISFVECDDDSMLPENGTDIVNIEAEEM